MALPEERRTVSGEIALPEATGAERAFALVVRVEDVSRADAPSRVVGEQRLADVVLTPGSLIPFEVAVPAGLVDEHHRYSVSAHVDVSGSGEIEVGDLLSTRSYPVLTLGHGSSVRVEVRRV